jgi:CBS domain-containing protein
MGLVTHALTFGVGYAAGMKVGDRPVTATKSMFGKGQESATTIAARAKDVGSRVAGRLSQDAPLAARQPIGGTSVDVRQIRDVMTSSPETVDVSAAIRDAASALERSDIGSIIATDGGHVRGVVTDRDIALRVVAAGRQPASTKVTDVMTPAPAVISPTATVQEAVALMRQHDVRRLPVVDSGRPVGVVSLGDLSTSSEARQLLEDISTAPPNN